MESSKLTDDELIEIANSEDIEECDEIWDVKYYQESNQIKDGNYRIYYKHLYEHYKSWSINPVHLDLFIELLQLSRKDDKITYIDNLYTNINISKLIGEYVKKESKWKKEERFRKISSTKPKTKCKN